MKYKTLTIILAFGILLSACATSNSVKKAPLSEGVAKTYEADYETVIEATRDAVTDAGLNIEETYEEDEDTFVILGKSRAGGLSWGEFARTVINNNEGNTTTVRVLTKKRVAVNVTAEGDFSKEIFSSLDISLR